MNKRGLGTAVLGFGFVVSGTANAQEFLKDRRNQEGIGVKVGDFELHPGVAAEIGVDSNWFLRSPKSGADIVNGPPNYPAIAGGVLRVTPSLTLATMGSQRQGANVGELPKLQFRASLSGSYQEFIGPDILRQQRNFGGQADLRLDILPGRTVGGAVFGNYTRTINPFVTGNPDLSYNRDTLTGGGELIITPGSGTLDWRVGYRFTTTLFEQSNGLPFDTMGNSAFTKGRWRFRPLTAMIYDASIAWVTYTDAGQNAMTPNSTPVRARLGAAGLITPRFGFSAMAGYGASFYSTSVNPNVQQYDSVIGSAELSFFPMTGQLSDAPGQLTAAPTVVAIGYTRDFQNSYIGGFYGEDRGYLKASAFFAGRVLVTLEGGVSAIEYPTFYFPDGEFRHAPSTDARIDATLFGEYRFSSMFGVNATVRFKDNISNIQLNQLSQQALNNKLGTQSLYDFNWVRVEAYLGIRWFL